MTEELDTGSVPFEPETKPKKTRKTKAKAEAKQETVAKIEIESEMEAEPKSVEETPPAPPKKRNYLNNHDLMKQIALSRQQDKMTDELAKMLFKLCQRYAKHPDYANIYSYKEDMEAFALLTVVKVWKSFNPDKSNNPFAYFTQVIRHAFYQYLNHEKRQREVKDNILVEIGELPSFTYMENYREERDNDYEGTIDHDEDVEHIHRPGYEATLPGEVKEIVYDVFDAGIQGELPPSDDFGDVNEI